MNEIVFEVTQEADGGFVAECLTESIVTQADDWEGLRRNVKEAVAAFYYDQSLRVGTLNAILRAVAKHKGVDRQEVIDSF